MIKSEITLWLQNKELTGELTPRESLVSTDFVFKVVGTSDVIKHTIFTDNTNGSYSFDGWEELIAGNWVAITAKKEVETWIEGVKDGTLDTFEVGSDDLRYAKLIGNQTFTGNQTIVGNIVQTGNQTVTGTIIATKIQSSFVPVSGADMVNKAYSETLRLYLEGLIAANAVNPYQESSQYRRVITDGVTETGKVYLTIASAIASLVPTSIKRCLVEITGTGTGGKILLNHSNVTSYVDIGGERKFNLVLGGSGATLTADMTFKNLNIWLGNYDIVGARTYTGITFEDCVFYSFQDLTFVNCKFRNCFIYQGSGKSVTWGGSSEIINTPSTQIYYVLESFTGFITSESSQCELNTAYSMPADPTDTIS